MSIYRTAMGKTIDMAALATKNERARAVGNVKNLNARGDIIDVHGKIIVPVTEKTNNMYANTVGNRSAHTTRNPARLKPEQPVITEPLTEVEKELEAAFEEDLEIEEIKAQELKALETKTKESKKK
jgi:hypothetical protein